MGEFTASNLSRRSFFKLSAVTALGVSIVGLAGCSSGGGSAEAGKTLTMLNYEDWMGENEIAAFAEKFGFEIEQLPTPDGGTTAWINSLTSGKGTYDFALAGNNMAKRLQENGLLAEFDASKVPNLSKIPESFTSEFPYGIPVEQGKLGFIYNKAALPTPPASFKELYDQIASPELAGKVLFPAYDGDVIDSALMALGYHPNTATQEQIDEAKALVISAKPSIKAFIDSGAPEQIIDGSSVIAIAYDYDFAYAAAESDAIGWIAPAEGCPGYLDGWVIMADSQNIDAVYEFFNFHLEDENYADFINTTWASWVMPSIKESLDPAVSECVALDPELNPGTFYTQSESWKTEAYAAAWQEVQNA